MTVRIKIGELGKVRFALKGRDREWIALKNGEVKRAVYPKSGL